MLMPRLQRREMVIGLAGLLVSPAIVRAGSLMPIRPLTLIRFVVEITHSPSKIIGRGYLSDPFDIDAVVGDAMRAVPEMPVSNFFDGTIDVRIVRESA